jgi:hypothetical protein
MNAKMIVEQNGRIIFSFIFPIDENWQFKEFSQLGYDKLREAHPSVNLSSNDIRVIFSNEGEP